MKRAIYKAITYRILGTCATGLIAYMFVGNVALAASIGMLDLIGKTVLYVVHEMAWELCRGRDNDQQSGDGPQAYGPGGGS